MGLAAKRQVIQALETAERDLAELEQSPDAQRLALRARARVMYALGVLTRGDELVDEGLDDPVGLDVELPRQAS